MERARELTICFKVVRRNQEGRLVSALVQKPPSGDIEQFPPLSYSTGRFTQAPYPQTPGCFAFPSFEAADQAARFFGTFTWLREGEIEVWEAEGAGQLLRPKRIDRNASHPSAWLDPRGAFSTRLGSASIKMFGTGESDERLAFPPDNTLLFRELRLIRQRAFYRIQTS